jgi:hypothetical protein
MGHTSDCLILCCLCVADTRGDQVQGMSTNEVASLIVGYVGEKVCLGLCCSDGSEAWSVEVTRAAHEEEAMGDAHSDVHSDDDDSCAGSLTPRSAHSTCCDDWCSTTSSVSRSAYILACVHQCHIIYPQHPCCMLKLMVQCGVMPMNDSRHSRMFCGTPARVQLSIKVAHAYIWRWDS